MEAERLACSLETLRMLRARGCTVLIGPSTSCKESPRGVCVRPPTRESCPLCGWKDQYSCKKHRRYDCGHCKWPLLRRLEQMTRMCGGDREKGTRLALLRRRKPRSWHRHIEAVRS
jgi:hypothetical protein